ncbi:uncharacterized protein LOC133867802 [Alnus glutinosa]|uniref:uncharacterized protein LOC133867802 n=1 Tax=Alnus glutinosa TaxID=3517 RepID=UPI002D78E801|nr:uncharacterized protein LOC133867802 [Alnus glutinosa]
MRVPADSTDGSTMVVPRTRFPVEPKSLDLQPATRTQEPVRPDLSVVLSGESSDEPEPISGLASDSVRIGDFNGFSNVESESWVQCSQDDVSLAAGIPVVVYGVVEVY